MVVVVVLDLRMVVLWSLVFGSCYLLLVCGEVRMLAFAGTTPGNC